MMTQWSGRIAAVLLGVALGAGCQGPVGPQGPAGTNGTSGTNGTNGTNGTSAPTVGTIAGKVKDSSGAAVGGAAIASNPASATATSADDGSFTLSNVTIGSYTVTATRANYTTGTLPNVGVAANATTNVSLVIDVSPSAPGSISGTVTDNVAAANGGPHPVANATVTVEGTSLTATTAADGTFSFSTVPPGLVFIQATPAAGAMLLPTETREAITVPAAGAADPVALVMSARPSDAAIYVGMGTSGCGMGCHGNLPSGGNPATGKILSVMGSAHNRSLSNGVARMINPILTSGPRAGLHLWPEVGEILDSGIKANNPAYDANDTTVPAASAVVEVYLCQPTAGEYAMKFGGDPATCADANRDTFPLVHIDVVYGGEGDRDLNMNPRPNYGVFKQRYQARLADCKVADAWSYTSPADKARDSLTLPVQITQSGNGGPKFGKYHPTEVTHPHESWTQRARTFSHACAGCHNVGMTIAYDMVNFTYPDGQTANQAAIKSYNYIDQNITCEHCHGPGSEHVAQGGGTGKSIINPALLTADGERQVCGKCHAYDDAVNANPAQDYGFEYLWNAANATKLGNGNFVGGVYSLSDYIGNWDERTTDEEAFWDPSKTGGKLYGQAHRQQYTMLSFSKMANNPSEKITCTSCHSPHSLYRQSDTEEDGAGNTYTFSSEDYRTNVLCLACHGGMAPFDTLTLEDVSGIHAGSGGAVKKNGATYAMTADEIATAQWDVAISVGAHMFKEAAMGNAPYDPTNEVLPTGRCTACHMPKVAKSGGYVTGLTQDGREALVEGDQGSHVFDIIWPSESLARSVGGPSPASAPYGTTVVGGVTYSKYGYMPNSCSKCHAGARKASDLVP